MLGFVFRVAWFTGKVAVKYVVMPVAVTAAVAWGAQKLTEKIRETTPVETADGVMVRPVKGARVVSARRPAA